MSKKLSRHFVTYHCVNTILFSECGEYRYLLRRKWDIGVGDLTFIMLNPSMANDRYNDPTVDKCMKWAIKWGFNSLTVVNLFARIETDRTAMIKGHQKHDVCIESEPDHPNLNDNWILNACYGADQIICAWGNEGSYELRSSFVMHTLLSKFESVYYMKMNKSGQPSHPLYLPNSSEPVLWKQR